jgi:hypothetical protein
MKIEKNLNFLLILLLFSLTSLLITTISLFTSVYAQENQTETTQIPEAAKGPVFL